MAEKEGETKIEAKKDIKDPKIMLIKIGNNLIAGGGAVSQELINTAAIEKFGNPEVINGIEMIVSQILAGTIKQGQISAFFNGFGIGAAKDLTKSLINFVKTKVKKDEAPSAIAPTTLNKVHDDEVMDFG